MAKMRFLFQSYQALLFALKDRVIVPKNLADALFYLGCIEEAVMDPKHPGGMKELESVFADDMKRGKKIRAIVVKAICSAKAQGRVIFRPGPNVFQSYAELNKLLEANGFKQINIGSVDLNQISPYRAYIVRRLIAEQGIPLEVL